MVDGVVVSERRQWKRFDPVVLLVIANGSEVLLHCLVLPLGLTVRLRVEGGHEAVIDIEVGPNSVPKSTGEFFAAIGGDIVWYAMFADSVFDEHSCYFWGVIVLSAGEVDRHISETVNDVQYPGLSRCR
jgi:hypothetical protein